VLPELPSYERINYALRPAKNVQRKMLAEALRGLNEFGRLEYYRYIGFGSTYFSDFTLFHKAFGMRNMISLERDLVNRRRFEFNCPFSCIQVVFGDSNDVLPTLGWDAKTILWLDYDGTLDTSMLTDVRFFCASAPAGSMLVVTVDAEPGEQTENPSRLEKLTSILGPDRLPPDIKESDLGNWGTASVFRRILTAEILSTLSERNGGLDAPNQLVYQPLFYFCYKDGSRMVTIGGLLYSREQQTTLGKCGFDQLDFLQLSRKWNAKPFIIDVPRLTYREIRHLDKQLPRRRKKKLTVPHVPHSDIQKYEKIYRFFPNFAETEV
jgi:hypothetical protein